MVASERSTQWCSYKTVAIVLVVTRRNASELVADCHRAVIEEVVEAGIGRLSVDGVARRAGVARTSLYRHWPTVEDLLLDALHDAHPADVVDPGGDLRTDLLHSLGALVRWLASPAARAAAEVLAERGRRPDLVDELYRRVFDARGGRFTRTVLEHYAARGEIDPRLVTPVVADIGEALVVKHQIDTGELPDAGGLVAIVDQALLPALGRTAGGAPS